MLYYRRAGGLVQRDLFLAASLLSLDRMDVWATKKRHWGPGKAKTRPPFFPPCKCNMDTQRLTRATLLVTIPVASVSGHWRRRARHIMQ